MYTKRAVFPDNAENGIHELKYSRVNVRDSAAAAAQKATPSGVFDRASGPGAWGLPNKLTAGKRYRCDLLAYDNGNSKNQRENGLKSGVPPSFPDGFSPQTCPGAECRNFR